MGTPTSTLCLGASGSGKSFYAVSKTKGSSLPKFVVNASSDDYPSSYINIDFESILDLARCICIVDDIIRPSEAESKILNEALVRIKRHEDVSLIFLSHNIIKNSLHSLIPHFDFITFPHSIKNTSCFLSYAGKYCPLDVDECRRIWNHFLEEKNRNKYLRYDVSGAKFEITDATGVVMISRQSDLRQKIERFIKPFGFLDESLALIDYLFACLPGEIIGDDLILRMARSAEESSSRRRAVMDVNIIDLIWSVSDSMHRRPQDKNLVPTFKALQKLYRIPFLFIKNDHFKGGAAAEEADESEESE